MTNQDIPIVFVETGRRPGKYLINNLRILHQRIPNTLKILIVNEKYIRDIRLPHVKVIAEESIVRGQIFQKFESVKRDWTGVQPDYWHNTTKRFFVLGNYLEFANLEKVIHLESDSVLLNYESINNEFTKNDWGLKFAKQHALLGCGSIVLVNKKETWNLFLKYVLANWNRKNITDMEMLGEFEALESGVEYLSSADNLDLLNKFIYDAVSIGHFFLGSDARNQRFPFSTRGQKDPERGALPLNFPAIKLNSSGALVYKDLDSPDFVLVNIHIHSKRIPKNYRLLERRLLRESNCRRGWIWKLGAFDFLVFIERLVGFILRRFLKIETFEFRLR